MQIFETIPFHYDAEAQSEEIRRGRGMRHTTGNRSGSKRMIRHGPWPPHHAPHRRSGGDGPAWGSSITAWDSTLTGYAPPSEQVRWVQFALNQIMNAALPTDGIASPEFRAALREFQRRQSLPVSGFVGPDTIAALGRTPGSESEWENMLQSARKPRQTTGERSSNAKRQTIILPTSNKRARLTVDISYYNALTMIGSNGKPVWQSCLDAIDAAHATHFRKTARPNETPKMLLPEDTPLPSGLYKFHNPVSNTTYYGVARAGISHRMTQYVTDANHLGQDLTKVEVRFLQLPGWEQDKLRALEILMNDHCINSAMTKGHCVNDQTELELPELSPF
jgi:hypothetical protein